MNKTLEDTELAWQWTQVDKLREYNHTGCKQAPNHIMKINYLGVKR